MQGLMSTTGVCCAAFGAENPEKEDEKLVGGFGVGRDPSGHSESESNHPERHQDKLEESEGWVVRREELEHLLFGRRIEDVLTEVSCDRRLEKAVDFALSAAEGAEGRLSEIAKACSVDGNHLNVMLRGSVGMTLHQIILRCRVLKAAELLNTSPMTTVDVALAVGFGSVRSLERNVRRLTDLSPGQLRSVDTGALKD
jgi:AraC-like DNA-binding protein